MAVYYGDECDELEDDHVCSDCDEREGARVRSFGFLREGVTFADPTSTAEWQAKVLSGDVVIIPKTNGTFDGGAPNYGPGFGDEDQRYINSTFKATYRDPNLKTNYNFYEGKKKSSRWKPFYRTESYIWMGDTVATIAPKAPVADDAKAEVVWEIEVSWISRVHPEPFDVPADIFDCFLTN